MVSFFSNLTQEVRVNCGSCHLGLPPERPLQGGGLGHHVRGSGLVVVVGLNPCCRQQEADKTLKNDG